MKYRTSFCIVVLCVAFGCSNAPPASSAEKAREQLEAITLWPEYPDAELWVLRAHFKESESSQDRRLEFKKLCTCLMDRVEDRNGRHIKEAELIGLLGPPDLESRDDGKADFAYFWGTSTTKDQVALVHLNHLGIADNVEFRHRAVYPFINWQEYKSTTTMPEHN